MKEQVITPYITYLRSVSGNFYEQGRKNIKLTFSLQLIQCSNVFFRFQFSTFLFGDETPALSPLSRSRGFDDREKCLLARH